MKLKKEKIELWLNDFLPKVNKTTSRKSKCRLILSLERQVFDDDERALKWKEISIFRNKKPEYWFTLSDGKKNCKDFDKNEEKFTPTAIQNDLIRRIFKENDAEEKTKAENAEKKPEKVDSIIIKKSELQDEDDELKVEGYEILKTGGEATLFLHDFGNETDKKEVVVRIQCFDPGPFTKDNLYKIRSKINLLQDYEKSIPYHIEDENEECVPKHENVIRNFCNIEIFHKEDIAGEDCLGWITIMEKGETNLFKYLETENRGIDERKRILKGILDGWSYLHSIGIAHYDMKLENIMLVDGIPKIIDFGLCWDTGTKKINKHFRSMGYVRRGSKFRVHEARLDAGTPGFCVGTQIHDGYHRRAAWINLAVFLLCEWKTAWYLLYVPVDLTADERAPFDKCKHQDEDQTESEIDFPCFYNLFENDVLGSSLSIETVDKIREVYKIEFVKIQAELNFEAPNKSISMDVVRNSLIDDFNEFNPLEQRRSDFCVPLTVASLFYHQIKNLKDQFKDINFDIFTHENIFYVLAMISNPRWIGGLGYRANIEYNSEIVEVLERFTKKTHLMEEGWRMIARQLLPHQIQADYFFEFEKVDLTKLEEVQSPVSVTCLFRTEEGDLTHQMVLVRIESGSFVLKMKVDEVGEKEDETKELKIPLYHRFFSLDFNKREIEQETWYIFPIGFVLEIKEESRKETEEKIAKFNKKTKEILGRVYTKRYSNYTEDPVSYLLNCIDRTAGHGWTEVKFDRREKEKMNLNVKNQEIMKTDVTPIMKEMINYIETANKDDRLYSRPLTRKDQKSIQSYFLIETIEEIVESFVTGSKWESAFIYKNNRQYLLKIRSGNSERDFPLTPEQMSVLIDYGEEFEGEAFIKKKIIDRGGEGLVMEVKIDDETYAAKLHLFDLSILSHGKKIEDYEIVTDIFDDPQNDLVEHRNIIKHVANSKIYHKDDKNRIDCLAWVTYMPRIDKNLWTALENSQLSIDQRMHIARSIFEGKRFLNEEYRIVHTDLKASNIFLSNNSSSIKIGDFGLSVGQGTKTSGSYQIRQRKAESIWTRKLGYRRPSDKFLDEKNLKSGTPGFAYSKNFDNLPKAVSPFRRLLIFLVCDWTTAWNINFFTQLTYDQIKHQFAQCGLDFDIFLQPLITQKECKETFDTSSCDLNILNQGFGKSNDPHLSRMRMIQEVMKLRRIIAIPLDNHGQQVEVSKNTAKSVDLLNIKEELSVILESSFENITKHVLDQKDTSLHCPIAVTNLLRYAINERLDAKEDRKAIMKEFYTFDKIFWTLLVHIYPRNFDGIDVNPSPRSLYKAKQQMPLNKLLDRLMNKNFMFKHNNEFHEGWKQLLMLIEPGHEKTGIVATSDMIVEQEILNENFIFSRPLVVTGLYITEQNGEKTENHLQFLLDRVENGHYILQSSLQRENLAEMTHLIRIPLNRPYYVDHDHFVRNNFTHGNSYQYRDPSTGISMKLVNFRVNCGLITNTWYLFPTAYSIKMVDNEAVVLKQQMIKCANMDLQNLTKNILDQKSSNLCVPISVTALLRFAIKNDLDFVEKEDYLGRSNYSFEQILTILTMIVYPRSLAGLNLNPKKEETDFQTNDVETLLRQICEKTYLMDSGWEIIRRQGSILSQPAESTCEFKNVLLNENFIFTRPLTVTGVYLFPDDTIFFHQMVLDRVDDYTDEYVLQNSSFEHGGAVLRIPKTREYYASEQMMLKNNPAPGEFKFYSQNGEFMWLVNEDFGHNKTHRVMMQKTWYLLPQAYSITLSPE